MTDKLYYFDEKGLEFFVNQITEHINNDFVKRMTTYIDEHSTDLQFPTAKAVYTIMQNQLLNSSFTIVTELPDVGEDLLIYFLKNDDDKSHYEQYIYDEGKWISIGSSQFNIDFDEYLRKEQLMALSINEISDIVDNA